MTPTKEQADIIAAAKTGNDLIVQARAGTGKEQPISSIVKTPEGDRAIGDLKVGDLVFGKDGTPTKVTAIFPQGVKPVYRVMFMDGSTARCGLNHNWSIQSMKDKSKFKTMTLEQILLYGLRNNSSYALKIPLCEPVQYPEKELPLHPYVLGAFLGDGSFTGSTPVLSYHKDDSYILDKVKDITLKEHNIHLQCCPRATSKDGRQTTLITEDSYEANPFALKLKKLNQYRNKHIPMDYLYGSVEQRLALLQGLMDTDGSISKGRVRFTNTNRSLIDGVVRLVQSLGGTCIEGVSDIRQGVECYNVNVKSFLNPFSLFRKAEEHYVSWQNPPSRYITNIHKQGEEEQVCITVEAGDSLYLTDSYIVTHNTSTCKMMANSIPKLALYVAYNKSIADEASREFPPNVTCKTMHSIAWGEVVRGTKYKDKLKGFLDRKQVRGLISPILPSSLSKGDISDIVEEAMGLVNEFCISSASSIADLPTLEGIHVLSLPCAELYWDSMVDLESDTNISHNTYLKLFQLSKPILSYGTIFLDEYQDSNLCVLDIVLNQTAQTILVGDDWQAIYAFNGAVNAFSYLPKATKTLPLTESFRFTQEVADTALQVLRTAGYDGKLTGSGTGDTKDRPRAILARTNSDLFSHALDLANQGERVYVIGGLTELFKQLYSANALQFGNTERIYDKRIASFHSWEEFCTACHSQLDLKKLQTILYKTKNLHTTITSIKGSLVKKAKDATVVLSTIHKSKGLSLGDVVISEGIIPANEDFRDLSPEEQLEELVSSQALNLAYIAITRSSGKVALPSDIKEFFNIR